MMDAISRRERLETNDNFDARIDYIVTLSDAVNESYKVDIRYIPDRTILKPEALKAYLDDVGALEWLHLESLGLAILSDLNNELVPRWVQVVVSATSATMKQRVALEDRQPRWDNLALLSRIKAD
jgi:7-cyano-7-deazaguanine reductase